MSKRALSSLLVLLALSAPAGFARAQDTPDIALAQTRFDEGRKAFLAGHFQRALAAFRASYALSPSPNSRLLIARSLEKLGHLAEARGEFRLAEVEATERARTSRRYLQTARAAAREGAALEPLIGHIVLTVGGRPPGLVVTLNERAIAPAALGLPIPVDPGVLDIAARAPGRHPVHLRRRLDKGETARISITLTPVPRKRTVAAQEPAKPVAGPERPVQGHWAVIAGWAGLALGAAAGVAAGVFYGLARSRYDDLSARCGNGPCPASLSGEVDEGRTFQTATNIAWPIAVGAGAAGAVLLTIGRTKTGSFAIAASPSAFRLRGRF